MAIHVLMLPRIVTKGGPGGAVCLAPHFGSLDMAGRRWGQASSRLGDETTVAVWLDCSDKDRDDLVAEVGGKVLGTALDDANAERVKAAIDVERPPRFDEMVAKRADAKAAGVALFSLKADAKDETIAAAFRAHMAAQTAVVEVSNDVASFARPALTEFKDAVAAVVSVEEAKV